MGFIRLSFLMLTLVLGVAACSDDTDPAPDSTVPIADGMLLTDGAPMDDLRVADLAQGVDVIRPDVYAQPQPQLGQLTLYVNLGDSIAAGWGIAFGNSYREILYQNDDVTYPDYAGKDLATRYPGIVSINKAIPGATSDEVIAQAQRITGNSEGDTLVTVSVGGNDLLNDYQALLSATKSGELAELVEANLDQVISHFRDTQLFPNEMTIAIFNVYDPTDGTGSIPFDADVVSICEVLKSLGALGKKVIGNFTVFNDSLREFAESRGLLLVDMHTAFLGHGFNFNQPQTPYFDALDPTLFFQQDCIHPNIAGHHAIRELIWSMLFAE